VKDKSIFRVQKDKENPYVMINKALLNECAEGASAFVTG
jgi:hypothetical protein